MGRSTLPGYQYTPPVSQFSNPQVWAPHRFDPHEGREKSSRNHKNFNKKIPFNPVIPHSCSLYPITLVFTILGHHANRDSTLDPT